MVRSYYAAEERQKHALNRFNAHRFDGCDFPAATERLFVIFLDKYNIDFFRKKFENLESIPAQVVIEPYIWLEDFDRGDANIEKIEGFISFLKKRGIDVILLPLPPCLLEGKSCLALKKLIKDYRIPEIYYNWKNKKYLLESPEALLEKPYFFCVARSYLFFQRNPKGFHEQPYEIFSKCQGCKLFQSDCRGVFEVFNHNKNSRCLIEKSIDARINEINSPKILEIGVGFLGKNYRALVKKLNSEIYCIDPSFSAI